MEAIKKELQLQQTNLLQLLGIMAGAFSFGLVLRAGFWVFSSSFRQAPVPVGCAFLPVGLIIILFCLGAQFTVGINNAVLMGRTRRGYFAACSLAVLLQLTACLLLAGLLAWLELSLPGSGPQGLQILRQFFRPAPLLAVVLGGLALTEFVGALLGRFGKKAGVPLWAVWFLGCTILPRIFSEEGRESLLGRLARRLAGWLPRPPLAALPWCGAALGLALFGAAFWLVRRWEARS